MENKLKVGEKYLTLQIGDLTIPFFPTKTKEGKKYYHANLKVWVNEKKQETSDKQTAEQDDI